MAAHLAVEIEADLLILMTDVDGVYTLPPGKENSLLISTYNPKEYESITYGQKSSVGSGGMQSKVNSALWHLIVAFRVSFVMLVSQMEYIR